MVNRVTGLGFGLKTAKKKQGTNEEREKREKERGF